MSVHNSGQQDGCGGGYGAAGGHAGHSCLRSQSVWEPGSQTAPYGVCPGGTYQCIKVPEDFVLFLIYITKMYFLSFSPHMFFVLQTKDVTAAMASGRFEDALKLRGKYVLSCFHYLIKIELSLK